VRLDGELPNGTASIDAVRTPTGVRVQTQNVESFTLTTAVKSLSVDGTPLHLKPGAPLHFARTPKGWAQTAGKEDVPARGPAVEAVNGRHIYVYGANDPQGRKDAEMAAAWSNSRVRINVSLPVKSDKEITDEDLASANLVLFGNRQTNSLIARFAPDFPLELDPGAADYGLLFVAPIGSHLALVSSGRSWWTGADESARGGYRYAPPQYRLLTTFGDYILFKGSLSHVLAEGRFDAGGKVPPQAAEALKAAGTVTVR
jgi:hypothetical protein